MSRGRGAQGAFTPETPTDPDVPDSGVRLYKSSVRYDSELVVNKNKKTPISGEPDEAHVSTSFIERQNLTMRMRMRQFTCLTNAFSMKIENHEHAIALDYMVYNFACIHQALRSTPAMKVGITDHH